VRLVLRSSILIGLVAALVVAGRSVVAGGDRAGARLLRSPGESLSAGEAHSPLVALLRGRHPAKAAAGDRRAVDPVTFAAPVYVSNTSTQAAEPSIRVDVSDPNKRIWISAPTGIGARTGIVNAGGDLFWHSDNNGQTWTVHQLTTLVGGGDSDATTGTGSQVYVTGLTLANVTLAASCDNGATWATNPIPTAGTIEDRQWLDMYEDAPKPSPTAPDFLLDIGLAKFLGAQPENPAVVLYQITSPAPACTPPQGGPPINTALPTCPIQGPIHPDCYQWPGNLAVDERTGDAYVTYNTEGDNTLGVENTNTDKVVVARIDGAAAGPVTQANANIFTAANNRPDTFDSFTAVAVDADSNVYVVWSERHPATGETASMYAYSTNKGVTWSAPIQVNQGPKTTAFPWPVAGAGGKLDIVYYGTDATGLSPEVLPGTSQWKVYMAQSLNATSESPTFTEVAATAVMHQGSVCTSGTGCAAGTRDLLDFFMIDIDEQCLANIAYTDNFNTPPPTGDHQEWVTFVQQNGGPGLCTPTAVMLRSLDARAKGRGIELRWRTGAEPSLLGFNLFRSDSASRETKVNRSLIRARGSLRGASYRLLDRKVRAGVTYLYRLQVVKADGTRSWDRSIRVTPR
jgi:hypothetical protein